MSPEKNASAKPITSMRFAVMKDLTKGSRTSAAEITKKLGEELASAKARGTLRLRLLEGGDLAKASVFDIALAGAKGAKGKSGAKAPGKATVELITTPETWGEIASGQLAPHDAFLGGRMRVRGNVFTAQRLFKHVAGSEGLTFMCREEE
jgi:putative sterol carrier protein